MPFITSKDDKNWHLRVSYPQLDILHAALLEYRDRYPIVTVTADNIDELVDIDELLFITAPEHTYLDED